MSGGELKVETVLSRTTYRRMKLQLESAWDTMRRYEADRVELRASLSTAVGALDCLYNALSAYINAEDWSKQLDDQGVDAIVFTQSILAQLRPLLAGKAGESEKTKLWNHIVLGEPAPLPADDLAKFSKQLGSFFKDDAPLPDTAPSADNSAHGEKK